MKTFTLPDLGEGLQDAEIVSWHVSVGDQVIADQPLVAVETEKAVVEVPAPWSGTVSQLHANPGDIVKIDQPHSPLVKCSLLYGLKANQLDMAMTLVGNDLAKQRCQGLRAAFKDLYKGITAKYQ